MIVVSASVSDAHLPMRYPHSLLYTKYIIYPLYYDNIANTIIISYIALFALSSIKIHLSCIIVIDHGYCILCNVTTVFEAGIGLQGVFVTSDVTNVTIVTIIL